MRQILGGRAPAEVANRAGHSVEVLLRSLRGEIRERRPRSDVAFRRRSGGRGIRTHGDVAATMVFESIRGSCFATTATCVVAVQAGSPSKIIPRISRARAATPRRHRASYALRACSRALLASSTPAFPSDSARVAGGDRWLLMAVRRHLGDTPRPPVMLAHREVRHRVVQADGSATDVPGRTQG